MGNARVRHDGLADALALLRAARHDPRALSRAAIIGRTYLMAHADDADAQAGARILDEAIRFLGVTASNNQRRRP